MKQPERLGIVNAWDVVIIRDSSDKRLGFCMDTPNNMAFAFVKIPEAHHINTSLGRYDRDRLRDHIKNIKANLKEAGEYHAKYLIDLRGIK